jgi:selenocysteine lyase/cysteine desulfurase
MPVFTDATTTSICSPLTVLGRDVQVPLITGGQITYAALDYAASAPVLQQVWDDVAAYAPYYGSVHRGSGYLSQLSTDLFEQSRATVAKFLGCREEDQVVFTRSTTDSLNLLAAALPAGTRVYAFETEHHAALLPWQSVRGGDLEVRYLSPPRTPAQAVKTLEDALTADAGDRRGAALVCVTGASNVTGELWPVRELASVAHSHAARIVLDAAQLAPHRPVDISDLDVDWVAFSGHKLYAPFGSGVLAGRADWLNEAPPYSAGGGATRTVAVHRSAGAGRAEVEWHTGTARHEAGSPNVIGAYAIASACRALTDNGFDRIVEREQWLLTRLRKGLEALPEVRMLSLLGDDVPRVGVVSFVVDCWDSSDVATALSTEYGIGVRNGQFCAHPLLRALLKDDNQEPGACGSSSLNAVRVSFGAGTPDEHIERFLAAITALVRKGPQAASGKTPGPGIAAARSVNPGSPAAAVLT